MSEQFAQLYETLCNNYLHMGGREEDFFVKYPVKVVNALEYLYNYAKFSEANQIEINEAIECGYLETLISEDLRINIDDIEGSYLQYISLREYDTSKGLESDKLSDEGFNLEDFEDIEIYKNQHSVENTIQENDDGVLSLESFGTTEEVDTVINTQYQNTEQSSSEEQSSDLEQSARKIQDESSNSKHEDLILNISKQLPKDMSNCIAYCINVKYSVASNKRPFLTIRLKDKNMREITGVLFNYSDTEDNSKNFLNKIVLIDGEWSSYHGTPTLNIKKIAVLADSYLQSINLSVDRFMPKPDNSLKEYAKAILGVINSVNDVDYKKLLHHIFIEENIIEQYGKYPAGISYHHLAKGQLLQHVCETVSGCIGMATVFDYIPFNMDLVKTGALLHDIGKLYELPCDDSMSYTHLGVCLGHIAIGIKVITQYATKLGIPDEKLNDLLHVITTHHGTKEMGSPVNACSVEAMLVHMCDNISGSLNHIWINAKDLRPHVDTIYTKGQNFVRLT